MIALGLFTSTSAQTDTIIEEDIIAPYPEIMEEAEEAASEEIYEAVPEENFDFNEGFQYEEPKPKKYDFQTRFGFGFVSLNNALSPVASGNNITGRYLPSSKFINSNISNFEISFGKNLSQGLWRLWFGIGIEDEYFTFEDANVRLIARNDSFAHKTVESTSIDQFGQTENATSSSFSFTTVSFPIAIGYQNKQRRPLFKFQFGAYLGYRFQSQTDVKYQDKTVVSVRSDFHTNPIILDPFLSFQYKKIGLFMRTSLMPILKNVGSGNEQSRNAVGVFIGM